MAKIGSPFSIQETDANKTEYSIYWLLFLSNVHTIEVSKNGIISSINDQYRELNDTIRCSADNSCETLFVNSLSKNLLGSYYRYMKNFYHINGYETPFNVTCLSTKKNHCKYDSNKNSLYVREGEIASIYCSVRLWKQGSEFNTPLEVKISDCSHLVNEIVLLGRNLGLFEFEIKSKCLKKFFNKSEERFSCFLKYNYSEEIIENFEVNLEIEYGPHLVKNEEEEELNKTITNGVNLVLECPITGYPLTYYWKSTFNNYSIEIVGEKEFNVSNRFEPGEYYFECRAEINHFSEIKSETVNFKVIIERSSSNSEKLKSFNSTYNIIKKISF